MPKEEKTEVKLESPAEPKPEENVVVKKEEFDALMRDFHGMKTKVQMLESIADKTQLAKFIEKTRDTEKRSCHLRSLRNDKGERMVVTGWGAMTVNEVYISPLGTSVAKQSVKVFLEDGSEVTGELLDVGRRYEFISADKVEKIKDYMDDRGAKWEVWKVLAENGKTYEIDSHFIN